MTSRHVTGGHDNDEITTSPTPTPTSQVAATNASYFRIVRVTFDDVEKKFSFLFLFLSNDDEVFILRMSRN